MPRVARASGSGQGPAKGPGNGKPRAAPLDTSADKQRERRASHGFLREKMRKWREEHPEYEPPEGQMSRAEAAEYVRSNFPPAIDEVFRRFYDTPSDAAAASLYNALRETGYGKDRQSLELSGPDGGPMKVEEIRRVIVDPRNSDG